MMVVVSVFQLVSLLAFLAGFAFQVPWLFLSGGIALVLFGALGAGYSGAGCAGFIGIGVVCAVIAEVLGYPWYTGLFWYDAVSTIIVVPGILMLLIAKFTKGTK